MRSFFDGRSHAHNPMCSVQLYRAGFNLASLEAHFEPPMARESLVEFFSEYSRREKKLRLFSSAVFASNAGPTAASRAKRFVLRASWNHAASARAKTCSLWAENCPEWLVAFWGCLLRGAVVVPIDRISTAEFAARVAAAGQRQARGVLSRRSCRPASPFPCWSSNRCARRSQHTPLLPMLRRNFLATTRWRLSSRREPPPSPAVW